MAVDRLVGSLDAVVFVIIGWWEVESQCESQLNIPSRKHQSCRVKLQYRSGKFGLHR